MFYRIDMNRAANGAKGEGKGRINWRECRNGSKLGNYWMELGLVWVSGLLEILSNLT
jgi:hypothetical protein